ncbi:hypothetical protein PFICI_06094 [Pestalotiopsis fici W106-1]|uniref:Biotin carboxylation domain-containing protein n=1 Tax=Pestalotiopsis fici (strain W106-1 / CGMCC3.15140) TaxID=1229662 RepID=W3X6R0_PESFW|nr:uncharacterized protein PFICI_06094 [Pestalotiopsis fici W106-1]ETS81092.1 hypothetical protein PFICI_06094 [Pestalotiopsis fici W106-1]
MARLQRVLIANLGEIAVRCIRACQALSLTSVALFTKADSHAIHVRLADVGILLEDECSDAYTDIKAILKICAEQCIDAAIPGYGFLSENVEFARRVNGAGMLFVGPDADAINAIGLKHTARELAIAANVPVIKGSGLLKDAHEALQEASNLAFLIIIKASGGGGGVGQQICYSETDVASAFGDHKYQ